MNWQRLEINVSVGDDGMYHLAFTKRKGIADTIITEQTELQNSNLDYIIGAVRGYLETK
jgi:hypothetical protein